MQIDTDGKVQWEKNKISPLPDNIDNDKLVTMIKLLAARVKQDHTTQGFNIDLHHYSNFYQEIYNMAVKNGYEPIPFRDESLNNSIEEDDDGSAYMDNIIA